jgi:hypothetical protein
MRSHGPPSADDSEQNNKGKDQQKVNQEPLMVYVARLDSLMRNKMRAMRAEVKK